MGQRQKVMKKHLRRRESIVNTKEVYYGVGAIKQNKNGKVWFKWEAIAVLK